MRPRSHAGGDQFDLFRAHFDQILNPDHPLVVLARKIDWQYFCGFTTMRHDLPLHPTSLVKWRKRVGVAKLAELLKETIALAVREKEVSPRELKQVNVGALSASMHESAAGICYG